MSQQNGDTILHLGWLLADQVGIKVFKLGIELIVGQR